MVECKKYKVRKCFCKISKRIFFNWWLMTSIWKYLVETPCTVTFTSSPEKYPISASSFILDMLCIYHLQVPFEYWEKKHISLLHYLSFKGDYFSARAWFISLKARVLPKWYIRGSIHLRQSAPVQWQFPTEENDKKYLEQCCQLFQFWGKLVQVGNPVS